MMRVMATGIKRQHEPPRIVRDPLSADRTGMTFALKRGVNGPPSAMVSRLAARFSSGNHGFSLRTYDTALSWRSKIARDKRVS